MGMFVNKGVDINKISKKTIDSTSKKISLDEDIDLSKIDFSFLENDTNLDWVDTSLKKHNEKRIKAYDNYAY